MAIDHGLQGRNSDKSKKRREKKAKKVRAIAMKAMNKKGEVLFDENARTAFLSGFRQRKMERRKFGIAMQMIKDKNKLKLERKEQRKAQRNSFNNDESMDDKECVDTEENIDESSSSSKEVVYDDNVTSSMFGSSVSVVVDEGLGDALDAHRNPDLFPRNSAMSRRQQFDTELQKAMKKAHVMIHEKKSSKKKNFGGKNRKGNQVGKGSHGGKNRH